MKIVFITRHCCIRVIKEALPLVEKGYDVHLITEQVAQYSDCFKTISVYGGIDHLLNSIKLHSDADLFHVHNEPSFFVTAVKDVFYDKPVIMDVHDTMLLRRTDEQCDKNEAYYRYSIDERNNFQLADGLVYVCQPMADMVKADYKLTQPSIVLPSYVPEKFYRYDYKKWIGGLVYEGRIDTADELPAEWDFFQYANYLPLTKKCNELEMDFHVYTPRKNEAVRKQYEDAGAIIYEPQGYEKLIKKIGSHDWGLVGNIDKHTEWEHALPNKLFEYMAGTVPVVAMNATESSRLIDEYKVGISVDSVEELAERWGEHREARKNVVKHRRYFAMENHISKLEELYKNFV